MRRGDDWRLRIVDETRERERLRKGGSLTSTAARTSFQSRVVCVAAELAVAVTLCALVVMFAGTIDDVSMRIGLIIAAFNTT